MISDGIKCCKMRGVASYTIDGYMWVEIYQEYDVLVRFCPLCGKQGKPVETHPEKWRYEDD